MNEQRWHEIERIFEAAVEHDLTERTAFVQAACAGDEALCREVERLLAADQKAQQIGPRFLAPPLRSATDTKLGHYRLRHEIARGGMGAVWLAERADEQFQQQVAIKLMRAGSEELQRRFQHERQILADLNHPNIARLLDGGTTAEGQPYFVMEYIEGVPLDEYCHQQQLSVRARLQLFRQVCAAVQYAHQHLIIHRDLKPANILVTADGTPKLLDFGVAKLLQPDLTASHHTQNGLTPMTPAYASPEQIRGETLTTASDVYSLGVVLYELLTGCSPYQLATNTFSELSKAICEQEPARPSTAARQTMNDERGTMKQRHSSLIPHPSSLRGDLDSIVLMALRKESAARYSSVEQFSADIQRYLDGLPTLARKGTFVYRAVKYVRRYKVPVAAAALILLSLLGGIGATSRQAQIARAEQANAEAQRIRAEQALVVADEQRRRAEQALAAVEAERTRAENALTTAEQRRRQAEAARSEANQQRAAAETQRLAAEAERSVAQTQRTRAEAQELSNRQLLYASRMGLAQQAWDNSNVGRTRELLDYYLPQTGTPDFRGFEWYYLWKLSHSELQSFDHPGEVQATRVSADGHRFVTMARFTEQNPSVAEVTVRDTASWQILQQFRFPTVPRIYSWALTSDGETLALTQPDGTTSLLAVRTGKEVLKITDVKERFGQRGMGFSPDGKLLAVGFNSGAIRLFETTSGQIVQTLSAHTRQINHVTFSPDGTKLISGGYDRSFILWDVRAGIPDRVLGKQNQGGSISASAVFSPDGKMLVIVGSGNLNAWELTDGKRIAQLKNSGHQIAFSPDGKTLAMAGMDAKAETVISLLDTTNWQERTAIKGHGQMITSLAWLPDGKRIISGSEDRTARVWDTEKIAGVLSVTDPSRTRGVYRQALLTPDGKRVLAATGDQSGSVWDAQTGAELMRLKGHTLPPNASGDRFTVAVSRDSKMYATGGKDTLIKLWDAETGQELRTLKAPLEVWAMAFSPDGKTLAVSCLGLLVLWDVSSGRELKTWSGLQNTVTALTFLPEGASFLTAGQNGTVKQWQLATGQLLKEIRCSNQAIHTLALAPNGTTLVTGGEDTIVRIWDVQTGQEQGVFKGHSARIYAVAFSPDGKRIASGSADKTIRLWDVTNGQELFALRDHSVMIAQDCVAFAPDGSFLFTADWYGTMKFWHAATEQEAQAHTR